MVEVPLKLYVQGLLKQGKAVARPMACLSSEQKNRALQAMADALMAQTSDILEARGGRSGIGASHSSNM